MNRVCKVASVYPLGDVPCSSSRSLVPRQEKEWVYHVCGAWDWGYLPLKSASPLNYPCSRLNCDCYTQRKYQRILYTITPPDSKERQSSTWVFFKYVHRGNTFQYVMGHVTWRFHVLLLHNDIIMTSFYGYSCGYDINHQKSSLAHNISFI